MVGNLFGARHLPSGRRDVVTLSNMISCKGEAWDFLWGQSHCPRLPSALEILPGGGSACRANPWGVEMAQADALCECGKERGLVGRAEARAGLLLLPARPGARHSWSLSFLICEMEELLPFTAQLQILSRGAFRGAKTEPSAWLISSLSPIPALPLR